MIWFNDQVLPRANHRLATLTTDISRKKPTVAFKEQIINEVSPNRLYLRAGHIDRTTSMMREVTIFDLSLPLKRRVIHADSGLLEMTPDQVDLLLTLFSGSMTELSLQKSSELQRNFFHTDFVKVRGVGNQFETASPDSTYKSDREMTICELESQVERAAKTRDSSWRQLWRLDRKTARKVQPDQFRPGLGAAYCALLKTMHIKTAAAAEVQAVQVPAKSPVQAPVQAPVKAAAQAPVQAPPQAQAQDTAKHVAPAAPGLANKVAPDAPPPARSMSGPPNYAPSTGRVVNEDSLSPSIRSVMAAGAKIQFDNAQDVVDGHSVEIEKKFAIAVACFIFVLLGAPVALRFPRGGVGMTIGVSLAVFGLYYVGLIVGETLADRDYMTPFWGMWSANFILGAIGLWLTVRLGHEGTTNRGSETTETLFRLRQRVGRLVRRRR
jgi:lipopolysaccharide export system permease protein